MSRLLLSHLYCYMCDFVFELCKCQQSLLDASLEDRLHTIHIHLSSLDLSCCLQVVRTFKLSTGQDDYAIMFTADYLSQIEAAKKRLDLKESLLPELEVFDWFVAQVIPSCLDVGISHSHLLSLLSQGGSVKDSHVSLLMNAGLLVRQLVDETAYWFSIPNVGFLLKSISSGRKELLSFLSRRRYKEMLQAPLERHALRYSQLGLRFHLRDLLGLGQLHVVPSPSGPLIRVVHD